MVLPDPDSPDDAEAFALGHREGDAAHGMDLVMAVAEGDVQIAHFEDVGHHGSASQAGSRFKVASISFGRSMLGRDSSRPRL